MSQSKRPPKLYLVEPLVTIPEMQRAYRDVLPRCSPAFAAMLRDIMARCVATQRDLFNEPGTDEEP